MAQHALSYSYYLSGELLFKNNSFSALVVPADCWGLVEVQGFRFPSCLVIIHSTSVFQYIHTVGFVSGIWTRHLVIYPKFPFCFSKIQVFRIKNCLGLFITIWVYWLRLALCLFKIQLCVGKHALAKKEITLSNLKQLISLQKTSLIVL